MARVTAENAIMSDKILSLCVQVSYYTWSLLLRSNDCHVRTRKLCTSNALKQVRPNKNHHTPNPSFLPLANRFICRQITLSHTLKHLNSMTSHATQDLLVRVLSV